jgi:hypothetical protein
VDLQADHEQEHEGCEAAWKEHVLEQNECLVQDVLYENEEHDYVTSK